jgi:uncharacterized protein YodC (DUF2158 family)
MKVGDVVCLLAGGPQMTVNRIGKAIGKVPVHCTWFEKNIVRRSVFDARELRKIEGNLKEA